MIKSRAHDKKVFYSRHVLVRRVRKKSLKNKGGYVVIRVKSTVRVALAMQARD